MSFSAVNGVLRRTGIQFSVSLPRSIPANEFGAKNPVVLLFGWYGAQQRALTKVAHVYNALGLKVVLGTATTRQLFLGGSIEDFLHDMLDSLTEHCSGPDEEDAPLVVQSCSNGGVFVYEKLLQALDEEQRIRGRSIAGAVFDSTPAHLGGEAAKNALKVALGGWQGVLAAHVFWNIVRPFTFSEKMQSDFHQNMLEDPLTVPNLYLYSRADVVTDYAFVDQVIHHKQTRGMSVMSKRWENSAHVSHLKDHREEYHELVASFLRESKIFAPAMQGVDAAAEVEEEAASCERT